MPVHRGITMQMPKTVGELRASPFFDGLTRPRSVKDELRENLISKLERGDKIFPGIVGYDDTVIPGIVNAILSRHNFILLGLRGQAKSRILREMVSLLDEWLPVIRGCEINDNPFAPICKTCRLAIEESHDDVQISFVPRSARYVEKLATPDVTIADLIGDVDPIKAARGGHLLSDELTIHYGLLPRANRGIFAINELPDLAGKIQVGLFNIMQEGDVQIKGYPVRLPLDVLLVFSANPEDYTARGKIITPLKDRIGSEIQTHYPASLKEGVEITRQESWTNRHRDYREYPYHYQLTFLIPKAIREIVEQIAFIARDDKRIDKRSGVSQRLPITLMEGVVSNAERRALNNHETVVTPRVSDIYVAIPAITGKIELEYEGEQIGAERVARDLIRKACGEVFGSRFAGIDFRQALDHFNYGNTLTISDMASDKDALREFQAVSGLIEAVRNGKVEKDADGATVSACELALEGLYAMKKLARTEEHGGVSYGRATPERQSRKQNFDDWTGGRLN